MAFEEVEDLGYTIGRDGFIRNPAGNIVEHECRGYRRVTINHTNYLVHRLIAEKYVPNPDNKPEINHIDECKRNNLPENLVWCSRQENMQHGQARLKASQAGERPITCTAGVSFLSIKDAARAFNVRAQSVSQAVRKGCRCAGERWAYVCI